MDEQSFKVGEFISQGWKFTKEHLGFLISYVIIMFIMSFLFSGVADALYQQGRVLLSVLMHLAGWIVGVFIQMGLYNSSLLITSGIKPGFDQLYSNDRHFISYVVSSILFGLMVTIGFILLIVPGFYLMARYGLFPYFILDKNMGPIQALEAASQASEGKRWFLFLMFISLILLNIVGALLLGIGLLFTFPITFLALAAVYRKITNTENNATLIT